MLGVQFLPTTLVNYRERGILRRMFTTPVTPQGLHPEVEVTLLRVAQEALANVAKHAGASRVGLTLSYMDDVVTLDVRDDGAGFRPPADGPGASGASGASGEADPGADRR